jgi:hypothetical protein
MVDAHKRGVKVQVILNKSQRTEQYSSVDFVAHAGIPTFIDARHAIRQDLPGMKMPAYALDINVPAWLSSALKLKQ